MKKLILILIISLLSSIAMAAGSGGEKKTTASTGVKAATKFDVGKKWLSKAKKFEKKDKQFKAKNAYEKAIKSLLEANSINPSDPDTLNLLGFSHRKIGDYENAEIYYSMGLEIDPKHVGINEYMGELFVATNRMDEAKKRLAVLENCNCKEYNELKQVIDGTKQSKY
jgi:tetratricopeptide (TPR) repeat protein